MPPTGDIQPAALAPAQSSSASPEIANDHHVSAPRSAKRKLEQQDATSDSLPSKKIRLSPNGDEVKRSLPGLRGGSTRRRQEVVGVDGEGSSSTVARETAAQSAEKNESESTSSSPKPAKDNEGGNNNSEPASSSPKPTSEPNSGNSNHSTEPTSSSSKPTTDNECGDDNKREPTSSSPQPTTDTECGESANYNTEPTSSSSKPTRDAECGENDDREPTSSSPQPDDSSATSTDNTSEPAKESKEAAIGPSDATDPETTTSEDSATTKGSETQASENTAMFNTRLAKKPQRYVSGLLNNSNQCFANSTIQFFDAATDGHDLDMILGEVQDTEFAEPMLTVDDIFTPPKKKGRKATKKPESKMAKVKKGILNGIKKLRKSRQFKDISPRRHLRKLLHRMRQGKSEDGSDWVTPFVFQQILAHGDENADRFHLDGKEQEDSYEYFQAVLAGLKGSPTDDVSDLEDEEKSAVIDHLFDFKSETATICTNKSCDHRAAVQRAVNNAHVVHVPDKKSSVSDLLAKSNVSELKGEKCPNCDTETLERRTEFTEVADNFVVHLNRTDMKGGKQKTAVDMPLQAMELCGKEYVLNAVIKHRGPTSERGHYTILRRRSPEWKTEVNSLWYLIDDHEVRAVPSTKVKDDRQHGQSSLLLYKAL